MGSKGLKAILIRRAGGAPKLPAAGRAAITEFHKLVATSARITVLRDYGTASTVMLTQDLGGLPTRNFSAGRFEGAQAISGEALRDLTLARGGVGTPTEACMAGCVIQCSNVFPDAAGGLAVAPLEFETLALCGSNLGLASLDEIARINRLCNDLGLDTIEVGGALGVMMEAAEAGDLPAGFDRAALPRFGDGARAAELVAEIGRGTPLGRLVGQGAAAAGQALGVRRVPVVKGQAMSAYDPRVIKGTGVTYATSPQGADHTAGLTVFAPVDHLDPNGAAKLSRAVQLQRAAYDALGLCVFNLGASGGRPDVVLGMLAEHLRASSCLPAGWMRGGAGSSTRSGRSTARPVSPRRMTGCRRSLRRNRCCRPAPFSMSRPRRWIRSGIDGGTDGGLRESSGPGDRGLAWDRTRRRAQICPRGRARGGQLSVGRGRCA